MPERAGGQAAGTRSVTDALRAMLPPGVGLSVFNDAVDDARLFAGEDAFVARAVEKRRAEFARGRACARKALAQLGVAPQAIPVGEGRQPVWPDGLVGSITHCEGLTGAVAAPADRVVALGIDAEVAAPLPEEVRGQVLHASEVDATASDPVLEMVFFSAKEAVHKALYPQSRVWMDFLDVEVALDGAAGTFGVRSAVGAKATAPGLGGLKGRFSVVEGFVLTVAHKLADVSEALRRDS